MSKTTLRHLICKLERTKDKEKILKAAKERMHLACRGTSKSRLLIMQGRRKWGEIFKMLKRKKKKKPHKLRFLYPAKFPFKMNK